MNGRDRGYLLVRAGRRRVGLALSQVLEVLDLGPAYPVPSVEPSVRGVTTVRGRIVPLVHLGALLQGGSCPSVRGEAAVMVELDGYRFCLEVEAAETVLLEPGLPVPKGTTLPWAVAVARHADGLVPLLDLSALGARFTEAVPA